MKLNTIKILTSNDTNYFMRAYYVSVAMLPSYIEYHEIFVSTLRRLG